VIDPDVTQSESEEAMTDLIRNSVDERNDGWKVTEGLLDDLGWGTLLISVGVLWMMPEGKLPNGTWMIAAGFIVLLFSVARLVHRAPVNGFSLAVGALALIAGVGAAFDVRLPMFPIGLIVIGLCMLVRPQEEDCSNLTDGEHEPCCR
jgi:hypothetical protein